MATYGTASSITIPADGETIDAVDPNVPLAAVWDQHDVLADTAALTAILVPTHGLTRLVRGEGHYVFVTSGTYSATTVDSPWILASGDGTAGRWVRDDYGTLGVAFTTYRGVNRQPAYVSAGPVAAGDTAQTAVVVAGGSYSYELKFDTAYAAGAQARIVYFPLTLQNDDDVITDASVFITPAGAHAGLPALMPGICVIRRLRNTGAISTLQSGGFVLDTSGGLGAYEATHSISTGAAIDQNNTVKNKDYEYFLLVQNEGNTNALPYLDVGGAFITVTTRRYQR